MGRLAWDAGTAHSADAITGKLASTEAEVACRHALINAESQTQKTPVFRPGSLLSGQRQPTAFFVLQGVQWALKQIWRSGRNSRSLYKLLKRLVLFYLSRFDGQDYVLVRARWQHTNQRAQDEYRNPNPAIYQPARRDQSGGCSIARCFCYLGSGSPVALVDCYQDSDLMEFHSCPTRFY